ncbi:MAG: hypothetical protein KAS96_08280 [Planctomycetes bacterium]|nr:hypothetical protein [Planctomycetota bacterium]
MPGTTNSRIKINVKRIITEILIIFLVFLAGTFFKLLSVSIVLLPKKGVYFYSFKTPLAAPCQYFVVDKTRQANITEK